MAFTVTAFFTIGFVVLVIIRDEIIKRETVVSGDKIDAGVGLSSGHLVKIGTTGKPISKLTECLVLAAPVVAHAIPILAVPLQP
jgi:hypothetical protein